MRDKSNRLRVLGKVHIASHHSIRQSLASRSSLLGLIGLCMGNKWRLDILMHDSYSQINFNEN
jgi:hypothetical protein